MKKIIISEIDKGDNTIKTSIDLIDYLSLKDCKTTMVIITDKFSTKRKITVEKILSNFLRLDFDIFIIPLQPYVAEYFRRGISDLYKNDFSIKYVKYMEGENHINIDIKSEYLESNEKWNGISYYKENLILN